MSWRSFVVVPSLAAVAMTAAAGADSALSEQTFRDSLALKPGVSVAYRNRACEPVDFEAFANQMVQPDAHADVDRAADGSAVTVTVRIRGIERCPPPYPPISELPPFELRDLEGRRVTAVSLRGKPTLLSFYFATCLPCIREVGPFNEYAAAHPRMNFLAVTFDEPDVARAFVRKHGLKWRVVPDAREFIDRVRVKSYPTVALFAGDGKLLGFRQGGARDELEAANVRAQLGRWVDGLLRNAPAATAGREVNP